MPDFERARTEFEHCIIIKDDHHSSLVFNSHCWGSLSDLARAVLESPKQLNYQIRWTSAIALFKDCGFTVGRQDFEDYTYTFLAMSKSHYASPIYEIFSYFANHESKEPSLEDFL